MSSARRLRAALALALVAVSALLLSGTSASAATTTDAEPPSVAIVTPKGSDIAPQTVAALFPYQADVLDDSSGVASVEFWTFPRSGLFPGTRLGAQTAPMTAVSSRYGIQADAAALQLSSGSYILQALATDKAGNRRWSAPEYVSIVVDSTSPTASIYNSGLTILSVVPPTDSYDVAVTFSEPLDAPSVAIAPFSISPALEVTRAVLQPDGVTVTLDTARQTPAADYTVTVSTISPTVLDVVGNPMRSPNTGTFRGFGSPDTTPPVTSISASPPAPDGVDGWFITPPTITLTATDPGGFPEDPITIQYLWSTSSTASPADDVAFLGPPYTFTAPTGANTLYYRSIDYSGVKEAWNRLTFKVDSGVEPPVIQTPQGSEGSPKVLSGTFDIVAKASDTNSGIARMSFWAYRKGATGYESWGTQIGPNQTAPVAGTADTYQVTWNTFAAVLDGTFRLEAEMNDLAGNAPKRSAPQYIILDNTAPLAKLTAPQAGDFVRGSVGVEGTATDANLARWVLEMRALPSGDFATLADGTTAVDGGDLFSLNTTSGHPDGRYELRLSVTDAASAQTTATVTPLTIDNTPPAVISATPGSATTVDVKLSEPVAAASVTPGAFTISGVSVSDASPIGDGATVRLTTSPQAGDRPYRVTAAASVTDRAGNPTAAANLADFTGRVPTTDTTPPGAPAGPTAVSGDRKNLLTWQANSEPDLDGYNVYRDTSRTGAFKTKANASLVRAEKFDDAGYGAPGIYYYRVTAVDLGGMESAPSPVVAANVVDMGKAIGSGGGEMISSTGSVSLSVPAGALASTTTLRVRQHPRPENVPGFEFVTPAFEFLPIGQTFSSNATIRLKEDGAGSSKGAVKMVYGSDMATWSVIDGGAAADTTAPTTRAVATAAPVLGGSVDHFTYVAGAVADTSAPLVTSVRPANGSVDDAVTSYVTLIFSEVMDPATITEETVQLRDGSTAVAVRVVVSKDGQTAYIYPKKMLDVSRQYTVVVDGAKVKDALGQPPAATFTSRFTTAANGVSPHDAYSASANLCGNCHAVHGAPGPQLLTERTEREVCYTCHDGTGSSYDVKTADATAPFASDFGESIVGTTSQLSYHPVPKTTALKTNVTMQCSNCHNVHGLKGTGARLLAVKRLETGMTGAYGPKTGNDVCWTCHDKSADASKGYVRAESWNGSTGYDHKSYYPAAGTSHNKLDGIGFAPADQQVPTRQEIACKGCHSEHGSANSKLIAETVNHRPIEFKTSTDADRDRTYNNLCNACHMEAGVGGFSWLGTSVYGTSSHGVSTVTASLSYAPPVPGIGQVLQVNLCKQCHEPHGAGDANGAYPNLTRDFEQTLCFRCHRATGNPQGAKDLVATFGRRYGHDLTLSDTGARKHDLGAETSQLDPNPRLSGTGRHVECTDCHNTHAAKNATQTAGHATVPGVLAGVPGVETTATPTPFSEPSTWQWRTAYPATYTYQVCFKCHSAAAYGPTAPARSSVDTTTTPGYWPIKTYTDQAKEFNPANQSYHAVWGQSKANPARGAYVAPWTATSAMDCSACHRSDTAGDPVGAHGSGTPFMLGGYFTPANAQYVTGPNGGAPYVTAADRDKDFAFCLECHAPGFSNTGFSDVAGTNLHTSPGHGDRACTNCHVAVPHGFQRDHLLVTTSDPAPYNDHAGQPYGILEAGSALTRESGSWAKNDCATAGPCHTP